MPDESEELKEIKKRLTSIEGKLDDLTKLYSESQTRRESVPNTLASLPEHLKTTALTIATMGRATAAQVGEKTGRTRAAESDYLNQLASRGFLKKERQGKEIHFLVFALYTLCPQCGARVPMTLNHCPICRAPLTKKQLL